MVFNPLPYPDVLEDGICLRSRLSQTPWIQSEHSHENLQQYWWVILYDDFITQGTENNLDFDDFTHLNLMSLCFLLV